MGFTGGIAVFIALIIYLIYVIRALILKRFRLIRAVFYFFFAVYIGCLAMLTLFPINVDFSGIYHQKPAVNLSLAAITQNSTFQNVGNTILLAPLVYFIAILKEKFTHLVPALLLAFSVSLAIETMQFVLDYFYLANHVSDINTIILNTLGGAFVGLVLYKFTQLIFHRQIELMREK